jgi:oxygen-independent coproporphyrinogen III oxidase
MAGIYIHIPYCEKKCIYCDFYSIENMRSMERFIAALRHEIALSALEFSQHETVETIFFGGGTPSLLDPSTLEDIVLWLRKHYRIDPQAEITVETNPGTVDAAKLKAFRSLGINRLSIGVQSFHEDELHFLSRIHSAAQAEQCVKAAYAAGFDNLSIDLMFALPGQSVRRWKESLRRAFALEPKHISAYSLIVEEQTPLFSMVQQHTVRPADEQLEGEMYETTMDEMKKHGYVQYEVSNYSLPGYESRHNKNYWNHSNYIGFGPSAHSFWQQKNAEAKRWWNVRNITRYCEMIESGIASIDGKEILAKKELFNEEIFLGLRTGGLDFETLRHTYGIDLHASHSGKLQNFVDERLMKIQNDRLRLTPKGFMLCDAIAEHLLLQE